MLAHSTKTTLQFRPPLSESPKVLRSKAASPTPGGNEHAKLDQQDTFRGMKDFLTSNTSVVISIGSVLVLILAYCSIQYIAILNCPEKLRLDKSEDSLRQYQAKMNEMERALNTTRQQNEKLNKDVAEITASKDGFARYACRIKSCFYQGGDDYIVLQIKQFEIKVSCSFIRTVSVCDWVVFQIFI